MDGFLKGKCIPCDLKVNETNAEYLVRKFAEAEAKCAALAAENAGLKDTLSAVIDRSNEPDYQSIGMGCGVEDNGLQTDGYNACEYGWREAMDRIYSEVIPDTIPETPATDAFLAEVRREASEPLQKEIEILNKNLLMSVGDIRDLIDYNPETGVLTAKVNFAGRQEGAIIGSQTWQGYYAFSLFGKKCFAHRLAWLLHYGEWPSQPIDHINGIKKDNSIRNLRLCSLSQNQFNKPTQKNNTTGVKGVYWNKRDKRYVASVQFNGKKYSAGHHKDIESAKEAVMKLREKLAGEFTNHGEFELADQLRQGAAL
ncbi:TPA: HNH endonuclease [Escherichia coli]|nr:HNH endonuclease [Escherichia coli]